VRNTSQSSKLRFCSFPRFLASSTWFGAGHALRKREQMLWCPDSGTGKIFHAQRRSGGRGVLKRRDGKTAQTGWVAQAQRYHGFCLGVFFFIDSFEGSSCSLIQSLGRETITASMIFGSFFRPCLK